MSTVPTSTFLIQAAVFFASGALLLTIPGQVLSRLGWAPIDPLASRLLGAALLAMAWGSFRGCMATERARVAILMEMEVAFNGLAGLALLRHLLAGGWPLVPWLVLVVFLAFALQWIYHLVRR